MTDLPKRELGRTGLHVAMLGYGAMELRGAPFGRDVTEAQSETILHAVLDAGINYIDTSIDYGLSEERIGRHIANRRSEYYLASKCGCVVGATPAPRGQRTPHVFTRDNIIAGVEQSLARMKTDCLDVLQFHASPSRQTLDEHGALEAVLSLKRAGKVRFIGMSATFRTSWITSRWACSMCFRSRTQPWKGSTKDHCQRGRVGSRHRHPRRCRQGCSVRGWRGRDAMGALAEGAAR
jgi:aryl-alcohol dehydrogenase-like predicted oxidoreductase